MRNELSENHNPPILYRKRFLPEECVRLKDDVILFQNDELLITSWKTLHPRKDLASGLSAYLPKEGFKVSKFKNAANELMFWYCDIITTDVAEDGGTIFVDLLIDIVVHKDGTIRILDLDEAGDVLDQKKISPKLIADALRKADHLLHIIYAGKFPELTVLLDEAEKGNIPEKDWSFRF